MSIEYLNKAFNAAIKPSSLKFLFVSLCDFASEHGSAYPAVETLEKKTSQNRKTVLSNLKKLANMGLIVDSGQRVGMTNQIVVWFINDDVLSELKKVEKRKRVPKTGCLDKEPKNGTVKNGKGTKNGTGNKPKNGTVKGYQKRDTEPSVLLTTSRTIRYTCAVGIDRFLDDCKKTDVKPVPDDDPIFQYALESNIEHQHLYICWLEFIDRQRDRNKRYKDWRQVFRNCVRENWYQLWWINQDGESELTSKGKQAQNYHSEKLAA